MAPIRRRDPAKGRRTEPKGRAAAAEEGEEEEEEEEEGRAAPRPLAAAPPFDGSGATCSSSGSGA